MNDAVREETMGARVVLQCEGLKKTFDDGKLKVSVLKGVNL